MPKYLCQGSYTEHGLKGLVKEGGSKRQAVVEQLVKEMGGKLEAFYFAFGSDDFVIILDLPSNVDMAAVALAAQASGAVKSRITILLLLEEIDRATKRIDGDDRAIHDANAGKAARVDRRAGVSSACASVQVCGWRNRTSKMSNPEQK